jgi:hypothetical protein
MHWARNISHRRRPEMFSTTNISSLIRRQDFADALNMFGTRMSPVSFDSRGLECIGESFTGAGCPAVSRGPSTKLPKLTGRAWSYSPRPRGHEPAACMF